jgi:hypothetical protein
MAWMTSEMPRLFILGLGLLGPSPLRMSSKSFTHGLNGFEFFECVFTRNPVSDVDVQRLKSHLEQLIPNLDLNRLQKAFVARNSAFPAFQNWVERHCRQRMYCYHIRATTVTKACEACAKKTFVYSVACTTVAAEDQSVVEST